MMWPFQKKQKKLSPSEMRHYSAKSSLKAAERNSGAFGKSLRAACDFGDAAVAHLSIATTEHEKAEGIAYLRGHLPIILHKTANSYDVYFEQIRLGNFGKGSALTLYVNCALAHACELIGDSTLRQRFVATANHPLELELADPFWRQYAAALDALENGTDYTFHPPKKYRLEEHYWSVYPKLIEAYLKDKNLTEARAECHRLFDQRQRDTTVFPSGLEFDGCAHEPVKWDFRLAALESFFARRVKRERAGHEPLDS